jgi:hypothetical protein
MKIINIGNGVKCEIFSHPSVERKVWRLNGKLHRLDGPAIEWVGGYNEFWINGYPYTEEEFEIYL